MPPKSQSAELTALKAELAALKAKVAALTTQLTAANATISALTAQLSAANAKIEELERMLWGYNAGLFDWTEFTNTSGRVIYVSDTGGHVSNDGFSSTDNPTGAGGVGPKKTIAQGMALMRNGQGDWCLLKKGDTFNNQKIDTLAGSGPSSTDPWLISAYGTGASGSDRGASGARPIMEINSTSASVGSTGASPNGGNNVAIVGLDFYAYIWDPDNGSYDSGASLNRTGVHMFNPSTWWLIEDCKFRFFGNAINAETNGTPDDDRHGSINIRGCIIVDCYSKEPSHSAGMFINDFDALLIEGCVFDHNGWNEHAGLPADTTGDISWFNHNFYFQGWATTGVNAPVTFRNNIVARDASSGQFRTGGTLTGNIFTDNSTQAFGMPTAVASEISGNVFLNGYTSTPSEGTVSCKAVETFTNYDGELFNLGTLLITDNVIAHGTGAGIAGIEIDSGQDGNVTITNNVIYDWANGIEDNGAGNTVSGNEVEAGPYSDSERDCATYNASIGGTGTLAAYLTECRLQSRDSWRTQYAAHAAIAYIRAGFGR
jgi:hypothetical protein